MLLLIYFTLMIRFHFIFDVLLKQVLAVDNFHVLNFNSHEYSRSMDDISKGEFTFNVVEGSFVPILQVADITDIDIFSISANTDPIPIYREISILQLIVGYGAPQ